MTYVITEACIDIKDGACVDVCPVDCIYEGGRMLYIHPEECIACGICESICPVDAIYEADDLPPSLAHFLAVNRQWFEVSVSGLGSPGGAAAVGARNVDHPAVAGHPQREMAAG